MLKHEFQAIKAQAFGSGLNRVDGKQAYETFLRLLPRQEDRDAYWDHVDADCDAWLRDNRTPRITVEELINIIDNERFLSRDIFEPLLPKLEHMTVPWLPVGTDPTRIIIYLLVLDPFALRAHNEDPPHTGPGILPCCFLDSAESDGNSLGMVFFQLGRLEHVDVPHNSRRDNAMQRLDSANWEDMGFALVVQLSAGGFVDGIYVMADLFRYNEETGEREPAVGPTWGRPPHPKGVQFSCPRVAGRLGDLGFDTVLEWTEIIDHPVELVWLQSTSGGRAIRATVVDPSEEAAS